MPLIPIASLAISIAFRMSVPSVRIPRSGTYTRIAPSTGVIIVGYAFFIHVLPFIQISRKPYTPHFLNIALASVSFTSRCLGTSSVSLPLRYTSWFPPCLSKTNPTASSFFTNSRCFMCPPFYIYYTHLIHTIQH